MSCLPDLLQKPSLLVAMAYRRHYGSCSGYIYNVPPSGPFVLLPKFPRNFGSGCLLRAGVEGFYYLSLLGPV